MSREFQRFGDFVDDAAHRFARTVWIALPYRLRGGVVRVERGGDDTLRLVSTMRAQFGGHVTKV